MGTLFPNTNCKITFDYMPAMQNAVAVEGVDMGVGSPKEMNQVHYLVKVVK